MKETTHFTPNREKMNEKEIEQEINENFKRKR